MGAGGPLCRSTLDRGGVYPMGTGSQLVAGSREGLTHLRLVRLTTAGIELVDV